MYWRPATAGAAERLGEAVAPHPRAAAPPGVEIPVPRVRFATTTLATLVVGGNGETPKLLTPLVSQPNSVPMKLVRPPEFELVVNVASGVFVVPSALAATEWKWYSVPGVKPLS